MLCGYLCGSGTSGVKCPQDNIRLADNKLGKEEEEEEDEEKEEE